MKTNFLKKASVILLMLTASLSFGQVSGTGQVKVDAPSVLSACSSDTIFFNLTNLQGPSCPTGTVDVEFIVTMPDTVAMTYQASSIGSMPAGAVEVSYATGVLTFTVPSPGFGSTTKAWIVLNSTCEVSALTPLPQLDVTINYPVGFTTPTESMLTSKMNVGVGTLTSTFASQAYLSTVAGFNKPINQQTRIKNTGFGRVTEVTYTVIIPDSMRSNYGYISANEPRYWCYIAGANVPAGSVSRAMSTFPDYSFTDLGTSAMISFTIKGADLDAVDGYLDPNDQINVNESYYRMPFTCQEDMTVRSWINYKCVGGGESCMIPDTLAKVYKVTAGTPIISGTTYTIDDWDGQLNKYGEFTFENTGIPDPTQPEVSTAYDVELVMSFGGILNISNLTIAGVTVDATSAYQTIPQTFPTNTKLITLQIKDLLTSDPDGPGVGLEDLDGDGYFDDMSPGATIPVTYNWSVPADAASALNLNYSFNVIGKYTDYCGKLNGSKTTVMKTFGFSQPVPTTIKTPIPHLGTLGNQDIATAENEYKFQYKKTNVDLSQATVQLILNYNKTDEVVGVVRFLGHDLLLENDFTVNGAGFTPPNSAYIAQASDATNNTTDIDSAIVYDLTPADIQLLFDNMTDTLRYSMSHISCDSFQTQTNKNTFQILYKHTPTTDAIDLAGNKSFAYNVSEGCGGKPYYITDAKILRESPIGFTDEEQTTPFTPTTATNTKFYAGDTLTYQNNFHLSGDWPIMEPIGFAPRSNNDYYTFKQLLSISYTKDAGDFLDEQEWPFILVDNLSYIKVTDTETGLVIADVPINKTHFYNWPNQFNVLNSTDTKVLGDNNSTYNGIGLGAHYCLSNGITVDQAYCPYDNPRYRSPKTPLYFAMQNVAQTRVTELYYVAFERALKEAGYDFEPGYAKYEWELNLKFAINENYPHNNADDFKIHSYLNRYGNGISPAPSGTIMSGSTQIGYGTIKTKALPVSNGGADYSSTCGLTISNSLDFNNVTGDFIPGEVRVPYFLDSITIDLPLEYHTTLPEPNLTGSNGGAANSIQYTGTASAGGLTGHILLTNNQANSGTAYTDFPRFSDADGNTTIWDVTYPVTNVGTDNSITETYIFPVKYFLRDEFGNEFVIIDSISITESNPTITVAALGSTVLVDDGGTCSSSYIDVLVANNTIYGAANVYVAAEGTANSVVIDIQDLGTVANPIDASDLNTYGNNVYAEMGGMKPAEQRIVRVFFNTFVCADSITVMADFGCNYPAGQIPNYTSTTIDSVSISYQGTIPGIMSAPINGNKEIKNLCDIQTLEVELRNVKNGNLYNILAGFKLPPNAVFVAGTAEIDYPKGSYEAATTVTVIGADSLTILLSDDPQIDANCGLLGADDGNNPVYKNKDRILFKIDVDFTACPTTTVDEVEYKITAENFCGTSSSTNGVFNFKYVGEAGGVNTYSLVDNSTTPNTICALVGNAVSTTDILTVNNLTGPATVAGDSLYLTVGGDATAFTLTNFTVAAPWVISGTVTTPSGRTILQMAVPAGIPANGTMDIEVTYDLTPLMFEICDNEQNGCSQMGYSATFFSPVSLECAAKGLNCGSIGKIVLGNDNITKSFTCCPDIDNDGVADIIDLDNDNDGIPDLVENGGQNPFEDLDGDGIPAYLDDNDNDANIGDDDGLLTAGTVDTDGDGIPDFLDLDSDNDGIVDIIEAGGVDADGDGIQDSQLDTDQDGIPDAFDVDQTGGTDADGDGIDDAFQGGVDTDGDGIQDADDLDADGNGIADVVEATPLPVGDQDGDGIPNYLDLDSDNDGISDLVEVGGIDTDGDGMVPLNADGTLANDVDGDGLSDDLIIDTDNDGVADASTDVDAPNGQPLIPTNTDSATGDTLPNYLDLDSDNDGIADIVEAGGIDDNNDGQVDYPTVGDPLSMLDADNDGLTDGPVVDTDGDGIADLTVDTDAGGTPIPNLDTDGDGIPNTLDLDSDGDGLTDAEESSWTNGYSDTDNDGIVGGVAFVDTDGDGWSDLADSDNGGTAPNTVDTDGDTVPNWLDLDSDNDGIFDSNEGIDPLNVPTPSGSDADGDGIDDTYDVDSGATTVGPDDNDTDGLPNYLDIDSDNDGIVDNIEGQSTSGYQLPGADTDGNGVPDNYETFPGSGISSINPNNADGDAEPDFVDLNSDNDGQTDTQEHGGAVGGGATDTDGDGLLDNFDFVDNTLPGTTNADNVSNTEDVLTFPNNQDPATLEVDFRDDNNFGTLVDTDGDGITDDIDVDDDNDGILDVDETLGFAPSLTNSNCIESATNFDGGTYESGNPAGTVGAIYRFTNVMTDNGTTLDALVEITGLTGTAVLNDIDKPTGAGSTQTAEWQPEIAINAAGDGMSFKVSIVNQGTSTIYPLDRIAGVIYDIDGANAEEEVLIERPGLYAVAQNTLLTETVDVVNGTVAFRGPNGTWSGVNNGPRLAVYFTYYNIPTFDITFSSPALNNGAANTHLGSITFDACAIDSLFDPANPNGGPVDTPGYAGANQTPAGTSSGGSTGPDYTINDGPDTDGDGIADNLDLDSDNDGVPDVTEAGGSDPDGDGHPGVGYDSSNPANFDADGLPSILGGTSITLIDTDGDGNPNTTDLDSDNDGISDVIEAGGTDPNNDGVVGSLPFIDSDGDGLSDEVDPLSGDDTGAGATPSGTPPLTIPDTDGDGNIDMHDLDSDNDGVADVVEAGGTDPDGDGIIGTGPITDNDGNGWSADADVNEAGNSLPYTDNDNDGLYNWLDIDSDNDGIMDIVENGGTDADNDGHVDYDTPGDPTTLIDTDGDGFADTQDTDDGGTNITVPNSDGDNLPDYLDIDADNDGIVDNIEGQSTAGYNKPIGTDSDNDGLDDQYDVDDQTIVGIQNTTSGNWIDPEHTDADGIPDYLDLDTDGDGDLDAVEGWDVDNDGTADIVPSGVDADNDGLDDAFDTNVLDATNGPNGVNGSNGTLNTVTDNILADADNPGGDLDWRQLLDTDGDGIPDSIDEDDDNDGILDVVENNGIDPTGDDDGDGIANYLDDAPNDPAIGDVDGLPNNDTDGDGIPDHLDLDSDNDGIPDITEAGGIDVNGDGEIDYPTDGDPMSMVDLDGNGVDDAIDATPLPNTDTDGDGVVDALDLDSDNDGITDIVEAGGTDVNGDGQVDYGTSGDPTTMADADNDGLADVVDPNNSDNNTDVADGPGTPLNLTDSDNDGIPNHLDLDSDNDGIVDLVEAGGVDADGDGMVPVNGDGTLVNDADNDGLTDDAIIDTDNDGVADLVVDVDAPNGVVYTPNDADLDGKPDYLDIDSDNDGITDIIEAGGIDADNDGHVDYPVAGDPTSMTDADNDGLTDDPVVDTTGDGVADQAVDVDVVGGQVIPNTDTDMDGLPDAIDIDADNDGIVDNIEGQSTNGHVLPIGSDVDGDGLDDAYDSDDNDEVGIGNGTGTSVIPEDTDNDGAPDYTDLDTDNDGEPDAIEGWDADNDGVADVTPLGTDADGDGLDDAFEVVNLDPTTGADGTNASNGGTLPTGFPDNDQDLTAELDWREFDADGDGISDLIDLDDDNDGIPDLVENGGVDPTGDDDGDGVFNYLDDAPNDPLIGDVDGLPNNDTDGDGIADHLDLDSDNDGIADIVEAGGVDTNGDGEVDGQLDTDGDGIPDAVDVDQTGGADGNNDGIDDLMQVDESDPNTTATDEDGDGIADEFDTDANGNGIADELETTPLDVTDSDNDGIPNYLDLDSDNDGITDIIEAGGTDINGDGQVDYGTPGDPTTMNDIDGDGFADVVDADNNLTDIVADGGVNWPNEDTDGDGIPNVLDLDSDNDGIADLVEAGGVDADGDGMVPTNTDGTLVNDADNDGLTDDAIIDTDNDGVADLVVDVDAPNGVIYVPVDTDLDGKPDYLDIDSDNDGITDIIEAGGVDTDNDGHVDYGTSGDPTTLVDVDGDGFADVVDTDDNTVTGVADGGTNWPTPDTDGDGLPNYLDIDADNDGIVDNIEGQTTADYITPTGVDTDGDGLDDAYDSDDATTVGTGDGPGTSINPIDTDIDSAPDYLDLDSDNDGESDLIEGWDTDGNGVIDNGEISPSTTFTDADGDGLDDAFDTTVLDATTGTAGSNASNGGTVPTDFPEVDHNGIGDQDWRWIDTDGDGIPDYLDIDNDNDGIPDLVEDPNSNDPNIEPLDTDGDGIPDIFDLDADNDGIPDIIEAGGVDANNDGLIDDINPDGTLINDTDGDGLDDNYDGDNGGTDIPAPDTDGDGKPDFQDIDSDGDGIFDIVEDGGTDSDNDGLVDDVNPDGTLITDTNGDGWSDGNGTNGTVDTDGDGTPDYLDLDSDNDGVPDETENDPLGDGTVVADTDGDGIPNYIDTDDDDDGILTDGELDEDENGVYDDCDADGLPDYLDPDPCTITVPEGFSPNGDGVNDFLEIVGIQAFPNSGIKIFNRWGNLVYKKDGGYNNDWDGTNSLGMTYGDRNLPTGTYFYVLDLGDGSDIIKGYIYLNK